jgi:hypothetical protein
MLFAKMRFSTGFILLPFWIIIDKIISKIKLKVNRGFTKYTLQALKYHFNYKAYSRYNDKNNCVVNFKKYKGKTADILKEH